MVARYTIDIPDERLAAIMAKVRAYDWNQLPDAGGWTPGVGLDHLRRLITYWAHTYDCAKPPGASISSRTSPPISKASVFTSSM